MGTENSDAKMEAQARLEEQKLLKRTSIFTLDNLIRILSSPAETAADRTARQLKQARSIAARESNCRPEDVKDEVAASIAQTLATNEQTIAARADRKR